MVPDAVAAIRRRLPAVPWTVPITVHFACDDKPLFGCRLCILRYGLRTGDRSHLFGSETEALAHIATHHPKVLDARGTECRREGPPEDRKHVNPPAA